MNDKTVRGDTPETNALAQGFKVKATWYNNATWSRDVALLKHARRLERERDELREALDWISKIALTNYEQDKELRANGARTLKRIGERADAALRSRS